MGLFSALTGVISGIQGASAAHNAATAQQQGYQQAAGTVNGAVSTANPIISGAAGAAGAGVSAAAGNAGTQAVNAANGAATGVTGAAGSANGVLDPFVSNGQNASTALNNLTAAGGFQFNPTDLQNTPGYQFELQQGNRGVNSSAAAAGLLGSGATGKAIANYDTGLAGTTYNQQYQNALQGYNANLSTYLPQAQLGLQAGTTQGSNLLNAAQYSGTAGINAAQYAGTAGLQGAQYAGNAGMAGANNVASNLINAGVYTGNTQIGAGNAIAQGDIGAANAWNGALGGIGSTADGIAGLAAGGGGFQFGNLFGASGFGGGSPTSTLAPGNYMSQTGIG